MAPRKTERNKSPRTRQSLVSPLLESTVQVTKSEPAAEQTWRKQKQAGKNKSGRSK